MIRRLAVTVALFLLLSALSAAAEGPLVRRPAPREHKDWFDAIGQFIEDADKISLTRVYETFVEGVANGLGAEKSIDRSGTLLYCPLEFSNYCIRDKGRYTFVRYEWSPGCRGYTEDCCQRVEINCREVLLRGERAAQQNLTLKDLRATCVRNNCGQLDLCDDDYDCGSFLCPDVINGPETPRCDPDLMRCYCAGDCGDKACDWREAVDGSCPQDCASREIDSDSDGLSDWDELNLYGTDPDDPDSDSDGMEDRQEIMKGSDPLDPDTDGGGQCDGPKAVFGVCREGSDPCPLDSSNLCFVDIPLRRSVYNHDSDKDGIVNALDPCPLDHMNMCGEGDDPPIVITLADEEAGDLDGDGMDDLWERKHAIEDGQNDPDNDGLTNLEEYRLGTDPLNADTDTDGMPDEWETLYGDMEPDQDDDNDGLTNLEEYYAGTDPKNPDTDGDGTPDGEEGLMPGEQEIIISLDSVFPQDSDPGDGIYSLDYGQTLQQVAASAVYANRAPLVKPMVIGELTVKGGTETIIFNFNRSSDRIFIAHPMYDILERNREAPFMGLDITSVDPFGNAGSFSTKLFVLANDGLLILRVQKPEGSYAYGQTADFEVVPDLGIPPDSVVMRVFSESTGEEFDLSPRGGKFVGEYEIPDGAPEELSFLAYARAEAGGQTYEAVRRVEVDVNPALKVTSLPADSSGEMMLFKITYPDGQLLSEESLEATINADQAVLSMEKPGLYKAVVEEPGDSLEGRVTDSHGNTGRFRTSLSAPGGGIDVLLQLILLLLAFLGLLVLLRKVRKKRMEGDVETHRKESIEKRKGQLKELIKATRNSFYKRQMTQEEAAKRIADYEAELKTLQMEEKGI